MKTIPEEPAPLSQLLLLLLIENWQLRRRLRTDDHRTASEKAPGYRRPRPVERDAEVALRIRINMLRLARSISQKDLARALGVAPSRVSEVLTGSERFPPSWVNRLADRLETTRQDLLDGLDWPPTPRKKGRPPRPPGQPPYKRRATEQDKAVGLRLRALLLTRGQRLSHLARHLGISGAAVSRVLRAVMALPPAWVPRLTHFFDMSTAQLFGDIDWKPPRR